MNNLDGKTIYQVFVRNYKENGTFKEITKDLDRIKSLGVDILYLMPIHEIGVENRKGTYGSPYAVKDYYSISKDLGNKNDLIKLIEETHARGMKIILDMVFNHTSPDNVLTISHPEFYYMTEGVTNHRIEDWSDVIDLDVELSDTQNYLIDVLKYWISLGIDGFRFDVASLIPIEFFFRAREALGDDVIFFAESVAPSFKEYLKKNYTYCENDEYLAQVFDCLYNYNYLLDLTNYFESGDKEILRDVIRIINKENMINGDILRSNGLENHDVERVASFLNEQELFNFTTMFISLRGLAFIYAGEEYGFKHKPALFEKDPIEWSMPNEELNDYIKEIIELKKDFGPISTQYIEEIGELMVFKLTIRNKEKERVFVLNLNDGPILMEDIIDELDDDYLISVLNEKIEEGEIVLTNPLIFTFILDPSMQ